MPKGISLSSCDESCEGNVKRRKQSLKPLFRPLRNPQTVPSSSSTRNVADVRSEAYNKRIQAVWLRITSVELPQLIIVFFHKHTQKVSAFTPPFSQCTQHSNTTENNRLKFNRKEKPCKQDNEIEMSEQRQKKPWSFGSNWESRTEQHSGWMKHIIDEELKEWKNETDNAHAEICQMTAGKTANLPEMTRASRATTCFQNINRQSRSVNESVWIFCKQMSQWRTGDKYSPRSSEQNR